MIPTDRPESDGTFAWDCALTRARHVEYFHDHLRIEKMLFDGAPHPRDGSLRPDRSRPGLGLELKRADASRFEVT